MQIQFMVARFKIDKSGGALFGAAAPLFLCFPHHYGVLYLDGIFHFFQNSQPLAARRRRRRSSHLRLWRL